VRNPITPFLPPVSNTGVEPSSVTVGWLAGTIRPGEPSAIEKLPFDLARVMSAHLPGGSQMGAAFHWYGKSLRGSQGEWSVGYEGVGDARGTCQVVLRQAAIETAPELVLALLGLGLRASRLDLAGDVHGDVARPRWFFDRRHLARTRTHVGQWVFREDGTGLTSLTLGARASERHARVYDKPTADGWRVRHELELKGTLAAAIAGRLLTGSDPATLWREEYGRLVQWR